jgi:hypothetical protein
MEDIVVPIALFACIPISMFVWFWGRTYARRMEREPAPTAIPADVSARLERMESAIDTIAIEIERISEGQRFTTKLLSERGTAAPSLPAHEGHAS